MLSRLYRFLACAQPNDRVTEDMLDTFEQARAAARDRGWWSYFRFAIREIAGLSPARVFLRSRAALVAGIGLAGLLLGLAAPWLLPQSYTSEASLGMEPGSVPEGLIADTGPRGESLDLMRSLVLSRSVLFRIADSNQLYPHLQKKGGLAVIERMRKAIRIESEGAAAIRVAFTYSDYPAGPEDRLLVQRATEDLISRIIDYSQERRKNQDFQTVNYFEWSTGEALDSWKKLNAQLRGISAADQRFEALNLDRDLARKHYETERQKLTQAQGLQEIDERQIGHTLSILDPASLPLDPDVPPAEVAMFGFGSGLLVGFLACLRPRLRRRILATA